MSKRNLGECRVSRPTILIAVSMMVSVSGAVVAQTINTDTTTPISLSGADANITITATGSITATNDEGINSTGVNPTITNNGTITTTGNGAEGINLTGDNDSTIINNGTITTDGIISTGINSTGEFAEITNGMDGVITTNNGGSAHGIRSNGDDSTITNDGMIITNGDTSRGILANGDDSTIINNGTITTSGENSSGIFAVGRDNANITLGESGSITTSGEGGHGIEATGADAVITINGTITTTDEGAHGIQSVDGPNVGGSQTLAGGATITVGETGSITTTGDETHGINSNGTGERSEITIGGKVSVSGEGSFVVLGGDDTDQTLILLSTAETQGEFNLGESEGDNDIVMVHLDGAASPSTFTIGGAETITLMGMDPNSRMSRLPRLASESGDSVSMLDPTGSSATRIALGAMTGQIRRQVFQRLDATAYSSPPDPVKSLGSWLTAFGRHSERNEDDLVLAWEHSLYGVSGGYDTRLDSGQRVGLLGGFGRDMIETSEVTSIEDSANHAFVGVYGRQPMGRLSLDGSVLLGYANHHGKRLMQGMAGNEIAYGDYNSVYINPSLALGWSRDLGDVLEFRPSVQLSYTYGYYNGYTESGTTNSNISFNSRSVDILDGRLELALARSFSDAQGEIELRGGATFTHYGEDSVGARLGGGALTSYRVPGDETIPGGYAGGALNYKIAGHVTLNGDIEYARASSGTESISGYLGLAWEF